jgi:hypothetical protein
LRHSRRAYEDRTKPTTSFTASMVWRAKFRARPAPSASTASIARISAGLINRASATVTRVQRAFQSLQPETKELVERRKCRGKRDFAGEIYIWVRCIRPRDR